VPRLMAKEPAIGQFSAAAAMVKAIFRVKF
jgi:hypothetical protein